MPDTRFGFQPPPSYSDSVSQLPNPPLLRQIPVSERGTVHAPVAPIHHSVPIVPAPMAPVQLSVPVAPALMAPIHHSVPTLPQQPSYTTNFPLNLHGDYGSFPYSIDPSLIPQPLSSDVGFVPQPFSTNNPQDFDFSFLNTQPTPVDNRYLPQPHQGVNLQPAYTSGQVDGEDSDSDADGDGDLEGDGDDDNESSEGENSDAEPANGM